MSRQVALPCIQKPAAQTPYLEKSRPSANGQKQPVVSGRPDTKSERPTLVRGSQIFIVPRGTANRDHPQRSSWEEIGRNDV